MVVAAICGRDTASAREVRPVSVDGTANDNTNNPHHYSQFDLLPSRVHTDDWTGKQQPTDLDSHRLTPTD